MPVFTVGLARTFLVKVEASSVEDAIKATDYVGHSDESWNSEKAELGFRILNIELVDNDPFDASESVAENLQ